MNIPDFNKFSKDLSSFLHSNCRFTATSSHHKELVKDERVLLKILNEWTKTSEIQLDEPEISSEIPQEEVQQVLGCYMHEEAPLIDCNKCNKIAKRRRLA